MIDDPRLIQRIAPYSGGHDANGFRNDTVPDHADIVTLGDSQTWGYNVERSETWPSMLQKYTSRTVYNMGEIEFGPVQYWVLTGDALSQLSPEIIIVGLYFGNDFYGAYRVVYHYDLYARFRLDQPDDELFLDTIKEVFDVIAYSENTVRYEDDTIGTVFTPVRRLLALDDRDKRIAEGVRITNLLLVDMAEQARAANVRLIVLLIPTKELVYAGRMQAEKSAAYDLVVRRETRLRELVIADLAEHDIEYVDALPAWRAALDRDQTIYPSGSDGHPNAEGHLVLSALLAGYLDGE
jgi:lysophospholipase L1-like esterase